MKAAALAVFAASVWTAGGCTAFSVFSPDGEEVVGRSMEFASLEPGATDPSLPWWLLKAPVGVDFGTHTVDVECSGLTTIDFRAAHGVVGIASPRTAGAVRIADGINSAGLSVRVHVLAASQYEEPRENVPSLCFKDVATYLLATSSSVSDAVTHLRGVTVRANPPRDRTGPTYQWGVTDANGGNIIVSYIRGVLSVHNNTVGVMTNDPPFPWHLDNLDNYVNLNLRWGDQSDIAVQTEVGIRPVQISHGANLAGLPGDFTPPARFVKAFYFKQFAQLRNPPNSLSETIKLATAILNSVFIPKGVVARKSSDANSDFTQFNSICLQKSQRYLFRTYDDMQWRSIDLKRLNWGTNITKIHLDTPGEDGIKDATGSL